LNRFGTILLQLLIFGTACLAKGQPDWKTNMLGSGVSITSPEGVGVNRRSPAGDFDLVTFNRGTNVILTIYLGNQPAFPKQPGTGSAKMGAINGVKVETVISSQKGSVSKEVLFRLRDDGVWPQRMHCWYEKLSATDSADADRMVSSVRIVGGIKGSRAP
jgi:hypothetical protein